MKNKVEDVRNHIVEMMELLGDKDIPAEEMTSRIERARTVSQLAASYTGLVKVEIDAIRLMDDTGRLPGSVAEPAVVPRNGNLRAIPGGR